MRQAEAIEYKPYGKFVLDMKHGRDTAGYCYACDLGYEDEDCTCAEDVLVVRVYR